MFLTLDGTSIIQLINFAIFFAILNVVFLRPVGAAIRKRREYIDSVKSDYDRYAHQIAALRAAAEQGRLAARREAEEIVSRERSDAEREAAQIVGAKTHEAGQIADDARPRTGIGRRAGRDVARSRPRERAMSDNFYAQLAIWSQIAGSIAFIAVLVWLWIKFLTPAVVASRDRKNAEL